MAQSIPDFAPRARGGAMRALLAAVAVVLGGLVATAAVLWLHYGTAVFFETIVAGIAACL